MVEIVVRIRREHAAGKAIKAIARDLRLSRKVVRKAIRGEEGAPLDLKFQSTVTKGIVSANGLYDGFSFIQSDVAVTHGNSGGPLLNEKGAVVGITDWGQTEDGSRVGLNFFIPIGDALDFLNLKTAP